MKTFLTIIAAIFICSAVSFAQSTPRNERPITTTKIPAVSEKADIKPHEIISKPQPGYTDRARSNSVEGIVHLKVELLANGTIGNVSPATYLSHGLTERAINAAKAIKFSPRLVNGQPVTTEVDVYYTFSLHYEDADKDIAKKVEITSMPKPVITASELPASANGKISVEVFFGADRRVKVFKPVTELSSDLAKRVETAVALIKFRPAVHRNGKRANVTKVIVYEIDK